MTPSLAFARALWAFDESTLAKMAGEVAVILVDARDPANDIPPEHAAEAQAILDDLLAEAAKRGGTFELLADGSIASHPQPRKDPA